MMISKLFHKKKKVPWLYTDFIISIDDIVTKTKPYFDKNNYYTCIRDNRGICIYIEEEKFKRFKLLETIYDSENNMINLSKILLYEIEHKIFPDIYHKTSPMSINIKCTYHCNITDINIYISIINNLSKNDPLFRDLINIQIMKDKYNLKF